MNKPAIPLMDSPPVRWFISPAIEVRSDYEAYEQQAMVLISGVLIAVALLFALLYWRIFDNFVMTTPVLGGIGVSVGALALLRLTGSSLIPGQIICGVILGLVVWLASWTGGIESPLVFWLLLVPIVAHVFYDKRRWTLLWSAIVIGVILSLYLVPAPAIEARTLILSSSTVPLLTTASVIGLIFCIFTVFTIRHSLETWLLEAARQTETEKHRAEQRLRKARERAWSNSRDSLRALMEQSPEGIVVHRDEEILYANPAFAALSGYDSGDIEGMSVQEFSPPQHREATTELLKEVKTNDAIEIPEQKLLRGDGTIIPIDVTAFRASFDEQPVLISIARDLSERHELQAKMMRLDRMAAIGNLAAGVAHEVNNPLSFVQSNVEFLLRRLSTDDTDGPLFDNFDAHDLRDTLCDTLEGTRRIGDIVSDLRTFSTRDETRLEPVNIEKTLESAINMASNQIEHRARLVRNYQTMPNIEADESALAQVFLNLLVNAAQAIPEGSVDTNEIRITTVDNGVDIIVEISDTGTGIAEDVRDQIFDPFVTTKSKFEGMGLGLAICHNSVQRLGGSIEVDSQPGEGSTFRVCIPRRTTADMSPEFPLAVQKPDETGRPVVVIDDEQRFLRAQKRQLQELFEVQSFQSAIEALDYLKDEPSPYLILCDLQMPEVSGPEFWHRLHRRDDPSLDRLVFMTGGAFSEEVVEFQQTTDHQILEKPFSLADVLEVAKQLHNSSQH